MSQLQKSAISFQLNIFSTVLKEVKDRFILFWKIEKFVLSDHCKMLIFLKLPVQYVEKSKNHREKVTKMNMINKQVKNEIPHETE